ncbi:uncharacterized protein V6R79_004094 [Siganus canaliculatus]
MSADQISALLDQYGIKHGPVVDTTRKLYEKKLTEAMAKSPKTKAPSDKTYYREEEEEVTYVHRTPVRNEGAGDSGLYLRNTRPERTEREFNHGTSYSRYSSPGVDYRGRDYVDEPYYSPSVNRSSYSKPAPVRPQPEAPKAPKSSRLIPLWVQFLFFLAVAILLYIVFVNMETNETLTGIE